MLVGTCCNLHGGKGDEHTNLCLRSRTRKFIRYYTFKVVVGRKEQSMKTESLALAWLKETTSWREREREIERESRHRPWLFFPTFWCSSNALFHLICLHNRASDVGPLFWAHAKTRAVIFVYLYIFVASVQLSSLPRHTTFRTNFQTWVASLLPPGVQGNTYPFPVVLHLHWRLGTSNVFLVISNYRSHLPMIGWPTTIPLAWLLRGQLAVQ